MNLFRHYNLATGAQNCQFKYTNLTRFLLFISYLAGTICPMQQPGVKLTVSKMEVEIFIF